MPQKTFYNCTFMKKSLKSVFFLSGIILFYLPLSAQTYRIEAGYLNQVRSGSGLSATYFDGAQVGVSADFALKNNFSYSVGGYYSFLYSFKEQLFPHDTYVRYTTYSHAIDIPVRLNYTLTIKKVKLFAYAGPNFNIGLYQPQKTVSTLTTELTQLVQEFQHVTIPQDTTHSELYNDNVLRRLNLQLGAGGGIQWRKFRLKSGYDVGLLDLYKSKTESLHQSGWFVSFGYEF